MQRERVSENVYWFQSDIYAQVTAGVIVGPEWAVVVDTLMPQETLILRKYVEEKIGRKVRYVINTHHHADHCWGNCFFPDATILGHEISRQFLLQKTPSALEVASQENPFYQQLAIIPPQITFQSGKLYLKVGKKNIVLFPTPGHSVDGISVLVEEDRVLFAGDVFMPLPFIVDGDIDQYIQTTQGFTTMGLENIIQGHGHIILRGEIAEKVKENITYLKAIKKAVITASRRNNPLDVLDSISIEACGKDRILIGGLASELHRRNLRALYFRSIKGQNE